jgi:molecular chaperone GrpE
MNQDKQRAETEMPEAPDEPLEGARQADEAVGQPAPEAAEAPAGAAEPTAREAELEMELEDTRGRLLRALADSENLRRRTARELEEARKYAITGFARELLEVADNLSRALESIPPRARDEIDFIRNLADGVAMTERALTSCFERHQIAKVTPEPGEKFDHNRHQAMFEVTTDRQAPGTIAQVLQPGYVIADRLLRPALVGVAKAPANDAGSGEAGEPTAGAGSGGEPPFETRPGERIDTTA